MLLCLSSIGECIGAIWNIVKTCENWIKNKYFLIIILLSFGVLFQQETQQHLGGLKQSGFLEMCKKKQKTMSLKGPLWSFLPLIEIWSNDFMKQRNTLSCQRFQIVVKMQQNASKGQ